MRFHGKETRFHDLSQFVEAVTKELATRIGGERNAHEVMSDPLMIATAELGFRGREHPLKWAVETIVDALATYEAERRAAVATLAAAAEG